jgi:hypothetical protein
MGLFALLPEPVTKRISSLRGMGTNDNGHACFGYLLRRYFCGSIALGLRQNVSGEVRDESLFKIGRTRCCVASTCNDNAHERDCRRRLI